MSCFYPLRAIQLPGGEIIFKRTSAQHWDGKEIKLPCGRCIGCRIQRAQDWATRCLHESQQHKDNAFITLTIAPLWDQLEKIGLPTLRVDNPQRARDLTTGARRLVDMATPSSPKVTHVDSSRSLDSLAPASSQSQLDRSPSWLPLDPEKGLSKNAHQKFIKRLRKKCGPLRYYMCGEYGEKYKRPHYHYLLFGYNFPDRYYSHTSESGEKLYRSAKLEKLWPHGKAWIGEVTYESCAYVAAYVMKKITGELAEQHYKRTDEAGCDYWLEPEFNEMSRRPGIARTWWEKYKNDVTTQDTIVKKNGGKMRPPRYYDKLLEIMDPATMAVLKMKRELRAKELADDNTPARLADKETVTKAKMALKKRNLEHK